jgi:NADP-dependent 3-hydroxy acid dehydrogenase YdfG
LTDLEGFHCMPDDTCTVSIYPMQAVLRAMIKLRFGSAVNIASSTGKWASQNQSAYNVGFDKAVDHELQQLAGAMSCRRTQMAAIGGRGMQSYCFLRQPSSRSNHPRHSQR